MTLFYSVPAGGPKWDRPGSKNPADTALLKLRKEFDLFANLRVVKVFPALEDASTLKPEVIKGVDLIILRELTSGMYFGEPRGIEDTPSGRRGFNTMSYTEAEIERILRVGFELARTRSKKLLSVDKSNVLEVSFLWRQVAIRLAPEYPDVQLSDMCVDAAAMLLVRDPRSLDVVVMENTFGDILSDEAAMLSGSLGMILSASLAGLPDGKAFGLYEPIHGSDPARAGKDVDNPIASILTGALMLRYSLGLDAEATAIEEAVSRVLERYRTWDIMESGKKQIGTRAMGDLISHKVRSPSAQVRAAIGRKKAQARAGATKRVLRVSPVSSEKRLRRRDLRHESIGENSDARVRPGADSTGTPAVAN